MRKVTNAIIALVALLVLCAYTIKQAGDIKKAEWLIGTWEYKTKSGGIYETWKKINDNEFLGTSYAIKRQDTIIYESIRLVQEQGGLVYIPTVKNQNGGLPVRFVAKTISETQLIFENPKHDFPQIISYAKISSSSLVAEISGTKGGQERKQTFKMKRVK